MTRPLTRLRIRPTAGQIGAHIDGVDLAHPSPEDGADLRAALAVHKVLFFRDQRLTHTHHIGLAGLFGKPLPADPHNPPALPDHPQILVIDPAPDEDRYGTAFEARFRRRWSTWRAGWHVDNMPTLQPPAVSILRADIVPDGAGDTHWTNLVAAYDALPAPLQRLADELRVEHRYLAGFQMLDHDPDVAEIVATMVTRTPIISIHPLVRELPGGERALWHSPSTACRIIDLPTPHSRALLDLFDQQITREEWRCRHQWRPGDVAIWDNRATAHLAAVDHAGSGQRRRLYRVSVAGELPAGPNGRTSTAVAGPSPS